MSQQRAGARTATSAPIASAAPGILKQQISTLNQNRQPFVAYATKGCHSRFDPAFLRLRFEARHLFLDQHSDPLPFSNPPGLWITPMDLTMRRGCL
jgi:hypothetical protein